MRTILNRLPVALAAGTATALLVACGSDEPTGSGTDAGAEPPTVVVTTSVWGDVVDRALGDRVAVEVLMPAGADPHDFSPSARQAAQMEEAELVISNGLGLEEGLTSVLDSVADSGTPVIEIGELVAEGPDTGPDDAEGDTEPDGHGEDPAATDRHGDEHDGDEHDGDEHDEDEHDHAGEDPHAWMDPVAVADALPALGDEVAAATGLDARDVAAGVEAYAARLRELDGEIESILAAVPPERRVLVTNHGSFVRFADRYDLEVIGTVIPANTTNAEASAADLDRLAELIREAGVPAIFAETTEPDRLARALADEVGGGVEVVELYTGSLGDPGSGADSFVGLHSTNAERIAAALGRS